MSPGAAQLHAAMLSWAKEIEYQQHLYMRLSKRTADTFVQCEQAERSPHTQFIHANATQRTAQHSTSQPLCQIHR